jgi:MraZ protein
VPGAGLSSGYGAQLRLLRHEGLHSGDGTRHPWRQPSTFLHPRDRAVFRASTPVIFDKNIQFRGVVDESGVKWCHLEPGGGGDAVFLGTYEPKLDEKGRIILPAKFRDELSSGLVLTRGQERCIYVFSAREFETMSDKIRQAPVTSKQARDYMRVFLSGASAETPDKQHRLTIPTTLRTYAGLDRDLAVIGAGSRVEIWDAAAWQTYLAEQEAAFAETAEEVIPGLF